MIFYLLGSVVEEDQLGWVGDRVLVLGRQLCTDIATSQDNVFLVAFLVLYDMGRLFKFALQVFKDWRLGIEEVDQHKRVMFDELVVVRIREILH